MSTNRKASGKTLVLAAVLAVAAAVTWFALRPGSMSMVPSPEPHAATETQAGVTPKTAMATDDSEPKAESPAERSKRTPLPAVIQPVSRPVAAPPATAPIPAVVRTEATPYTRQLVDGLTNLNFSHGPISKEHADQWKQSLQGLIAQGSAAAPAIRDFLEQNQELNFAAIGGGEQLEQSSLRSAMINALAQIGGPEATSVMLQTLQATTLPSEIAQLALILEQQAPGQYRQEAMNAINEVLGMAGKGELPAGWDVAPLFKTLQNYGDPAAASVLDQLQPEWKYYATMSLASLQGGIGVPSLVREVQDLTAGSKRDFAYQMLAQIAGQYPDVGAALLEQARANQISDSAWRKIATGLGGDQYAIGVPPGDPISNAVTMPGLKTYHIQSGSQNFHSLPVSEEAVEQRLALINQLLSATASPTAQAALQSAKDSLIGKR
jgi:hypothetical protein